jgi:1-pyrroline-2-carboxylate reductase [NAD(P)H]
MKIIDANEVNQALNFSDLINALEVGFGQEFTMPQRQVFPLDVHTHDAFAVLPAWNEEVVGVKSFTYFPSNVAHHLPILFSKILLFSRAHGEPLAMVDGTTVTYWRTAAVSALASRYLARKNSQRLLLLGTGNLAKPLVRAHLTEHALTRIDLWGRNAEKMTALQTSLQAEFPQVQFVTVSDLSSAVKAADIIIGATGAAQPLVLGCDVPAGCHVDLLGNHHPEQRECDTALVEKARVFVDYRENVLKEAGELLIPIREGKFSVEQVQGDLAQLCRGQEDGQALGLARRDDQEITLFKSVGTALSDLICAKLVLDQSL